MEFKGLVYKVLPVVKGQGARGEWTKQEVVLEMPDEFNRKLCVGFWGDKALDAAGVKPKRTFLLAALTGVVEVVGTIIGYYAVTVAETILPFALAFAGGTMLYVVSDEMIPETHAHGHQRGATYALLIGFSLMLLTDVLLG